MLQLQGVGGVTRDQRSIFAVRNICIGAQTVGDIGSGFNLEAFFDGLDRRYSNVAATHDGLNLLMTVGKKQGSFAIEWIGAPDWGTIRALDSRA